MWDRMLPHHHTAYQKCDWVGAGSRTWRLAGEDFGRATGPWENSSRDIADARAAALPAHVSGLLASDGRAPAASCGSVFQIARLGRQGPSPLRLALRPGGGVGRGRRPLRVSYGLTILLARTPIPSTSASTRSPALRKFPVAAPTPSGVPVAMMSPGKSVMAWESTSMHWATGKIILEVWLCWRT